MEPECNATDPICKSGEQPTNVFLGMKWVENGRFELKLGGIEARWQCGPFGKVVKAKTALRNRFFATLPIGVGGIGEVA